MKKCASTSTETVVRSAASLLLMPPALPHRFDQDGDDQDGVTAGNHVVMLHFFFLFFIIFYKIHLTSFCSSVSPVNAIITKLDGSMKSKSSRGYNE